MEHVDVLVVGGGLSARIVAVLVGSLKLESLVASGWRAWNPRTVALPASTVGELGFLGIERAALEPFRTALERGAGLAREDLWLVSEQTIAEFLSARHPAAPTWACATQPELEVDEDGVTATCGARQVRARVAVIADPAWRTHFGWVESARLALETARAARRPEGRPHAFALIPGGWVWGVAEQGCPEVTVTRARLVPPPPASGLEGETTTLPEDLLAAAGALGLGAATPLAQGATTFALGVATRPWGTRAFPAGPAQAAVDPLTALGLRTALRSATGAALACRGILESPELAALAGAWHVDSSGLEAALAIALAGWQHTPPPPAARAARDLTPAWADALPRPWRTALGRKLVTHQRMTHGAFIDVTLAPVAAPEESPGLALEGARLAPTTRRGCPLLGLVPGESARLAPLLAALPATPRALVKRFAPREPQVLLLDLVRLTEAGVGTYLA